MQNKVIFPILALFFILNTVLLKAQPLTWESRCVSGGGANFSPAINPYDSKNLYLSSDVAGLFVTDNQGINWTNVDYRQVRGNHPSEVQFTSDPKVLYVISYKNFSAYPARSDDGGKTWRHLTNMPENSEVYYLFADPHSTERFIVGFYTSFYLSEDGGKTYQLLYRHDNQKTGLHLAGAYWFKGGSFYCATGAGLFRGTNASDIALVTNLGEIPDNEGFMSFTGGAVNDGIPRFYAITYDKSQLYAGIWGNDVLNFKASYTSRFGREGELSWMKTSTSLSPDFKPTYVDMAQNQQDTVYMAGGNAKTGRPLVLKTTDGGTTWQEVMRTQQNENTNVGWCGDGGGFRWYWGGNALGFSVSPTDAKVAFYTNWGFAELTTDGGETWNSLYVFPEERSPKGTLVDLAKARYHSNGLDITGCWDISWADSSHIIAGFTDIQGIHSQDGGQSWGFYDGYKDITLNTQYNIIKHTSTGKLFASSSEAHDMYQSWWLTDPQIDNKKGRVLVSDDKGLSWKVVHNFGNPCVYIAWDTKKANKMYALIASSEKGGVYVCEDILATPDQWTQLPAPPRTEGHPYIIRVLKDGTLVCTYSGRRLNNKFSASSGVFVSTDGGQTWEDRSDPFMKYWTKDLVIDPHDVNENTWYVGVFSGWGGTGNNMGGLYRSKDRGNTWHRLVTDFTSLFVESCTFHPQDPTILYVTTDGQGILYSKDIQSKTPAFQILDNFPFPKTNRIYFNPYNPNEVWVATYGNGIKMGRVQTTGMLELTAPKTSAPVIYPNPAHNECTVSYRSPEGISTTVKVYNAAGTEIGTWNLKEKEDAVTLNTSKWAEGIYIAFFNASDGTSHTQKLIIIR